MALVRAQIVFLLFCSAYSYQFIAGDGDEAGLGSLLKHPEREWNRLAARIDRDNAEAYAHQTKSFKSASGDGSSAPEPKRVPDFVIVPSIEDPKALLKPQRGSRPLPDALKPILQRTSLIPLPIVKPDRPPLVEMLCHIDRMYVRIRREVFRTWYAFRDLKLGTCSVNAGTRDHFYHLYLLKTDCGFNQESFVNYWSIRNFLRFNPTGPVLREMPFDIPLQCKYYRYFHSYSVGFYPKLQGGTVFKALTKTAFTLTTQDASGNDVIGTKTYTLGQTMYFVAKRADGTSSGNKRVYIDKCVITTSRNPNSNTKYTIIDNHGCMLESKFNEQSQFIAGTSKMALRFRLDALILKDGVSTQSSSQQIYMYCDIFVGNLHPTPSSKACTYDRATRKWKELYSDDSVCTCCASTCASVRASKSMISSHSWKVDMSNKDGYNKDDAWPKFLDDETFGLEDPDTRDDETS